MLMACYGLRRAEILALPLPEYAALIRHIADVVKLRGV